MRFLSTLDVKEKERKKEIHYSSLEFLLFSKTLPSTFASVNKSESNVLQFKGMQSVLFDIVSYANNRVLKIEWKCTDTGLFVHENFA